MASQSRRLGVAGISQMLRDPGILEPRKLCEPDLHVFAKLFEIAWKGVLKPRHFLGVR